MAYPSRVVRYILQGWLNLLIIRIRLCQRYRIC